MDVSGPDVFCTIGELFMENRLLKNANAELLAALEAVVGSEQAEQGEEEETTDGE
jgi:hypothetical protein